MTGENVYLNICNGTALYCKSIKEVVKSLMYFRKLGIPNIEVRETKLLYDLDISFLEELYNTKDEFIGLQFRKLNPYLSTTCFVTLGETKSVEYLKNTCLITGDNIESATYLVFGDLEINSEFSLGDYMKYLLAENFSIVCHSSKEINEMASVLQNLQKFSTSQPYMKYNGTEDYGECLWKLADKCELRFALNQKEELEYHIGRGEYYFVSWAELKKNYNWIVSH